MLRIFVVFLFGMLLCQTFSGCNNLVGLHGKVTYTDTGDPVTQGEIQLSTPTFFARATIQPDGTYAASSFKAGDGLPVGTYSVAIISFVEGGTRETNADGMPVDDGIRWVVNKKYADPKTSGLTVTVDKSTQKVDFKVDR